MAKAELQVRRRDGTPEPQGDVIARRSLGRANGTPLDLQLRVSARDGAYDFHYREEGKRWQPLLLDADGRILSTEHAGGFVGALFGLYAYTD